MMIRQRRAMTIRTIPPGSVSGTTTITITPINDKRVEGDETIRLRLTRTYANNQVTVQDAEGNHVKMTVVPVDITLQDTGEGGASFFAADAAIDDYTTPLGRRYADLVLPEASGGTADLTYGVSGLPTGLSLTRPRDGHDGSDQRCGHRRLHSDRAAPRIRWSSPLQSLRRKQR